MSAGYQTVRLPQHPKADATSGHVYVHVLVAEGALGRYLPEGAQIHHVNGVRSDNRPQNLVICQSKAYHKLLHTRARILRAGGDPNRQIICGCCRRLCDFSTFTKQTRNKGYGLGRICSDCRQAYNKTYKRPSTPDAA